MSEYNDRQKLLINIAIILFIVINLVGFLIALPSIPIFANILNKKPINLRVIDNRSETQSEFDFNQTVSLASGIGIVSLGNTKIVFNAPFSLKFDAENRLSITNGVGLIDTQGALILELGGGELSLPYGFKGIYNSQDESLVVLVGEVPFRNNKANKNQILTWEVDNFKVFDFNRAALANEKVFSDLRLSLQATNQSFAEIEDIQGPSVTNIQPESGESTEEEILKVSGIIEKGAKIKINGRDAITDNLGNFSIDIELEFGQNNILIETEDEYGNKSLESLSYFRERMSTLTPISAPIDL